MVLSTALIHLSTSYGKTVFNAAYFWQNSIIQILLQPQAGIDLGQ